MLVTFRGNDQRDKAVGIYCIILGTYMNQLDGVNVDAWEVKGLIRKTCPGTLRSCLIILPDQILIIYACAGLRDQSVEYGPQ